MDSGSTAHLQDLFVCLQASIPIEVASTMSTSNTSPALAGPLGEQCFEGVKHVGTAVGKTIKIADIDTYVSEPPAGATGPKKVILYFADVFGPFFDNAKLLQDYFASHGTVSIFLPNRYRVLGMG